MPEHLSPLGLLQARAHARRRTSHLPVPLVELADVFGPSPAAVRERPDSSDARGKDCELRARLRGIRIGHAVFEALERGGEDHAGPHPLLGFGAEGNPRPSFLGCDDWDEGLLLREGGRDRSVIAIHADRLTVRLVEVHTGEDVVHGEVAAGVDGSLRLTRGIEELRLAEVTTVDALGVRRNVRLLEPVHCAAWREEPDVDVLPAFLRLRRGLDAERDRLSLRRWSRCDGHDTTLGFARIRAFLRMPNDEDVVRSRDLDRDLVHRDLSGLALLRVIDRAGLLDALEDEAIDPVSAPHLGRREDGGIDAEHHRLLELGGDLELLDATRSPELLTRSGEGTEDPVLLLLRVLRCTECGVDVLEEDDGLAVLLVHRLFHLRLFLHEELHGIAEVELVDVGAGMGPTHALRVRYRRHRERREGGHGDERDDEECDDGMSEVAHGASLLRLSPGCGGYGCSVPEE